MPFPLIIPALVFGALAYLARSGRGERRSPVQAIASGELPSPLVVLATYLRAGHTPPPTVIMCAIAEAEASGRVDLAEVIVRVLVLPVVQAAEQAQVAQARDVNPLHYSRYAARPHPAYPEYAPPTVHDRHLDVPALPAHQSSTVYDHGVVYRKPGAGSTPDEDAQYVLAQAHAAHEAAKSRPGHGDHPSVEVFARHQHPGAPGPHAGTVTVSGKSSPIEGVGTAEWSAFVGKVSRELPTYMAARHVGQFRQRRDRLEELGLDPDQVVESPEAQVHALELDMSDAYRHAHASGLLSDYVGRPIDVPFAGEGRTHQVTCSGVLGVIQAAGLEGAASWLEDVSDRKRFSGTTAAFLRTNGVF